MSDFVKNINRVNKTIRFVTECTRRFSKKNVQKTDAIWLKQALQNLGPTYIKIGQFMSTRNDIFDPVIVQNLSELQDNVDPIAIGEVQKIIIDNTTIHNSLKKFELNPIAAASIGQVHRAVLKNDKMVAIKIKRPDIYHAIEDDVTIVSTVVPILNLFVSQNHVDATSTLVKDFKNVILAETDYLAEAKNMKEYRKHNMNTFQRNYTTPRVYEDLSTDGIIVMDYLPSTKPISWVKKAKGEERKSLANDLMDIFIGKLVLDGIVHGDPHEGNIGVLDDGSIVFYDFGNMLSLDLKLRQEIKNLLFEIVNDNLDGVMEVIKNVDVIKVKDEKALREYVKLYIKYLQTVDIKTFNIIESTDRSTLSNIPVEFDGIVFRLIRAFGLIEGLCKRIDADFNYTEIFTKYVNMMMIDDEFIKYKIKSDLRLTMKNIYKFIDSPNIGILFGKQ